MMMLLAFSRRRVEALGALCIGRTAGKSEQGENALDLASSAEEIALGGGRKVLKPDLREKIFVKALIQRRP
jgi:hypothetical protein